MMNPRFATRAGAIALASLAVPALASADAFDGFYVAGTVGLFTDAVIEVENDTDGPLDGRVDTFGVEETFPSKVDLVVGLGHRIGALYLGVEGAYTISNDTEGRIVRQADSDEIHGELGDGSHIGLRAGYFLGNWTVGYVKAASGLRNIEESGEGYSGDEDFSGSGYGFGIEHRLGPRLTMRLEAMRFDYSTETLDFGFPATTGTMIQWRPRSISAWPITSEVRIRS